MRATTKTHVLVCLTCHYVSDPLTPERGEKLAVRLAETSRNKCVMHVLPLNIGNAVAQTWIDDDGPF